MLIEHQWIDTHSHLAEPRLFAQLDQVLARAHRAGVGRMICVGTTAETSQQCVAIAETNPSVFASVGLHPTYCHEVVDGDWEKVQALIDHPRVVAIGETGLDLYWKECPLELQQASFAKHWTLSQSTRVPVIIHMRDCEQEMIEAVEAAAKNGPIYGVLHSFAGSEATAHRLLELGLYLSFAGMVTYKKADDLRAIVANVPEDRILVETDSPYLSPEPHRSMRPNEPAMVVHTAKCVAEARGISLERLSQTTTTNALRLFTKMN